MAFQVEEVAFELIAALRPVVARIRARDRGLADQLSRAASSVALNIAESNYSDPGNRRARLFTAAGSANETRAALRVAVAWGYCAAADAEGARALLERAIAMLWKLTRCLRR
jgi:four helix bundle protein